jgi:hypothetical protein
VLFRSSPALLINAHLLDLSTSACHCSLGVSAGLVGKTGTSGSDLEYIFGPTVGFLDDRILLTPGVYGGRQQLLGQGLSVGGAAPTGAIPTINRLTWKFGFALTYRIQK